MKTEQTPEPQNPVPKLSLPFLTMLVWALPILIFMTLLSFLSDFFLSSMNISGNGIRYVGPMAVGFIIVAACRIGRKVVTDRITLSLFLLGGITTYFIRAPWIFPLVLMTGGMAARGGSVLTQVLGAIAGGVGIFLPGLLLIYFIYPIWENLKTIKGIKISIKGITAVAGGLITAAAIILMQKSGFTPDNILIMLLTVVLLGTKKIPAPLIVLFTLTTGFIVPIQV